MTLQFQGTQTFMMHSGILVHNTLNSVTYDTEIIVRDSSQKIKKCQIGEFVESCIKNTKKVDYNEEKDTTYAPTEEFYEIPSVNEEGEVSWKRIEAGTQHPVVNEDGTDTLVKVTTIHGREVIATKAKSFLQLKEGKIVGVEGKDLKVGDYLPVSLKPIDIDESGTQLNLREFFLRISIYMVQSFTRL